jgi:hypothetical protein
VTSGIEFEIRRCFEAFFEVMCDYMPHLKKIGPNGKERTLMLLPHGMYNTKVQCVEEMIKQGYLPAGTVPGTAKNVWNDHFWHVRLREWQPFTKCEVCARFKAGSLMVVNEMQRAGASVSDLRDSRDLIDLKTQRLAHYSDVQLARLRVLLRSKLAEAFPELFMCICIDGMDNQKTNLPHCNGILKNKGIDNEGEALQTKLIGALVDGIGFQSYMTLPTVYHGSNVTWTVLLHVLHEIKKSGRTLPPVLFLQLDNCARDNKNQVMFAFAGLLIHCGVFEEVYINFLPVGHTHCEIDQHFSVISRMIENLALITPEHLLLAIRGLFKDDGDVRVDTVMTMVSSTVVM